MDFTPDGRAILTISPDVAPGHAAKVLREAIAAKHPQGVSISPTDLFPPKADPRLDPSPFAPERPAEPDTNAVLGADDPMIADMRRQQEAGELKEADAAEFQDAQHERSRMERWAEGLRQAAACIIRKGS